MRRLGTLDDANIHEWAEFKLVVHLLIERLSDQQPLLVSAALKGLSLIGSVASLPLTDRSNGEASGSSETGTYNPDEKMDVDEDEPKELTKSNVAQKVLYLLRSAHSRPKTKEEAAYVLGSLAIGDGAFFTKGNLDAFIKMIKLVCFENDCTFANLNIFMILMIIDFQTKDPALNIAIAQGIVLTIAGRDVSDYETSHDFTNPHCDDECLDNFLNNVIRMVADPNPASRNSTGIWLLALVKNFSKRAPILKHREILQYAFTELLSDDSGEHSFN